MGLNTVQPSAWGDIFNITAEKGSVVLEAAANAGRKVTRVYGYNSSQSSDHRFRQCIDFMHYGDMGMRDWLVSYLIKNAGPLGIMGIISNRRCMGFPENERNAADCEVTWRGPSGTWRTYSGADPHTDHVHVQFNTNAVGGGLKAPAKSPAKWNGKSFPGAGAFVLGKSHPAVKVLGQRLVAHGFNGYKVGPGETFTAVDMAGVKQFQRDQGWTGSDADGYPGAETWRRLMAPEWHGKLYLIKTTKAYDGNGHYKKTYKAGTAFTGYVDKAYAGRVGSKGRYFRVFRVPHRLWLPLDDRNFSHTKNGKAL